MGEEIFDRLDVLARQRDQVAGAAPHQIGRRQRVELAEQVDPHLGQQPVGDVVGEPAFEPVEQPGERRGEAEQRSAGAVGRPALDRGDRERPDDADADKGGDPGDPGSHDDREFAAATAR